MDKDESLRMMGVLEKKFFERFAEGEIELHNFAFIFMNPEDLHEEYPEANFRHQMIVARVKTGLLQVKYFDMDVSDLNHYCAAYDDSRFVFRGFRGYRDQEAKNKTGYKAVPILKGI